MANNIVIKILYLLSPFLFTFPSAYSQDIEEMVVNRVYTADKKSPVTYQDFNKKDLQTIELTEPSFFLQKTPSIISYSDAGSYQGYSYFRLRGIDQTRINMTLDGIPLNEPEDQGVYFSNYPGIFSSLEKMQIQRGVGSSQNGTASYAGSIQLHSVDLRQAEYAEANMGYGSFDSASGSANYLSGLKDGKSFYINLSGVSSNGYKDHSGNQSYSLFISGLKEDETGAWRFLGFSGKQENQLAWIGVEKEIINQNPNANANTSDENDRYQQSLVSFAREQILNDQTRLDTRVYYNYLQGSYDFDFNNFIGLPSDDQLYNYALTANFFGAYSNLHWKTDSFDFSAGIHINDYKREHIGSEKTMGKLYNNRGYRDTYAAFVKANYYLNDWNLFADIQYRYSSFDYRGNVQFEKMDWHFTNPRIGASYQITESLLGYYSLGKTGREPTRTDLFGGMDNLEIDDQGHPVLYIADPESVINHEMGLRYQSALLSWEANIFYMSFDKEITLKGSFGPNGLLLNQDVDKSIRRGLETTIDWEVTPSVFWRNLVAFTHAEITDQGQSLTPVMTPRLIGLSAIEYRKESFSLGLDWRYQSDAYISLANNEKIEAYDLINLFAIYRQSNIEYKLSVNNLFDEKYFASGMINASAMPSYFVGVPINFHFGIRAILK